MSQSPRNKRQSIKLPTMVWIMAIAMIVAMCGINYALVKNEQTAIQKELSRLESKKSQVVMNIHEIKEQTDQQMLRWVVLDRLSQQNSQLAVISPQQIELIIPGRERQISQNSPRTSLPAQD